MSKRCVFCRKAVNPYDLGSWKQVIGWVGGQRKDSMTLRQDTGLYAHDHCVNKAREGQPVDQPDLFGEDKVRTIDIPVTDEVEELLDDKD